MLTLIALSAALMQQPPAPPAPPEVRTRVMVMSDGPGGLDTDGDGHITREEVVAPLNDRFARMDKDGDGRLSPEELTAGHGVMPGGGDPNTMIMRGPGGPGGPGERRTMVFVDGAPGARGEREIAIHGGAGGHGAMAGARRESGPGERIEIRRTGGLGGENDLDADNDGRINEAEFLAPLREAFRRMDADRSGFIETGERGAGRAEVFVHRIETRQNSED